MGTRNLTMVYLDGEYKVAQYGQWDGYPEGQGVTILNFLQEVEIDKFKEKVRNSVKKITPEILTKYHIEAGGELFSEAIRPEVFDKFKNLYPQFSRDTGAKVLEEIMSVAEGDIYLKLDTEFAKDSLFCEWAYVVDLDQMVLEVYAGNNLLPLGPNDRFFWLQESLTSDGYWPVKMICSFPLNKLPPRESFIEICNKKFSKYSKIQERAREKRKNELFFN